MDWNSITTLAQAQGTVFWVASAAVSLGLTLLVVALVQAARQRLARRTVAAATSPREAPAPVVTTQAAAAYAEHEAPVSPLADDDSSLVMMLRRLQQAGDRLEEIAADRTTSDGRATASALKSGFQDVEYVFRASGS